MSEYGFACCLKAARPDLHAYATPAALLDHRLLAVGCSGCWLLPNECWLFLSRNRVPENSREQSFFKGFGSRSSSKRPKTAPRRPETAQDSPKKTQESTRQPQERPREPHESPRKPQDSPKRAQDSPERAQDSPKSAQESPKNPETGPRQPQESPKTAQDSPKTAPRQADIKYDNSFAFFIGFVRCGWRLLES